METGGSHPAESGGHAVGDELHRLGRIVSVDCFPAHLPMRKPLKMATHQIAHGPSLFVRVRAASGAEGWGEAGADPTMSGETLRGMVAAVEEFLAPRLSGASVFDRIAIGAGVRRHLYGNGGPKAAVDMALLDLAGRILGVPAVELLGGAARRSATVLRLIGGSRETDRDVAEAEMLADQGFKAFKLKVGLTDIAREAETVRRLRDRLGDDVLLAADANMGWDVATARRFAGLVAGCGLAFLEQPVVAGDINRMAAVAAPPSPALGADEALHSVGDILAHANAGAIRGVSLKTMKFGGVTTTLSAATVADALGLCVNLAMLVESSVASAAMVHLACAIPQIDWGLSVGGLLVAEDPVAEPIGCVAGEVACPVGPGLGVTVDERALRRLAPQ